METGRVGQGGREFSRSHRDRSQIGRRGVGFGHALARQGKLAEAAPHFRQAAQLEPARRDALLELADLYQQNHQAAEALAIYREFPGDAVFEERAGELMLRNNQSTEAIPSLEQAYAKEPTEANRVALAMAYQFSGKGEKALPLFERAAAADPANFDIHMMYAAHCATPNNTLRQSINSRKASRSKPTTANLTDLLWLTSSTSRLKRPCLFSTGPPGPSPPISIST